MIIRQMLEISNGKACRQSRASGRRCVGAVCVDAAPATLNNNFESGAHVLRAGALAGVFIGAVAKAVFAKAYLGFGASLRVKACGNKKAACIDNKRLSVFGCGGRI